MPITLAQLKRKVGKVTLFGDEGSPDALEVEYYLVIDETLEQDVEDGQQAAKITTPQERIDRQARQCIQRIAAWNLTDDEGKAIPLTVKALTSKVPHEVLTHILTAIGEDMRDPNSRRRAGVLSSPS